MTRYPTKTLGLAATVWLAALAPALGDPEASTDKPQATKADESTPVAEPTTVTVARQRVRDIVELKGVFESAVAKQILLRPLAWAELKIVKVVPHGKRVKQGECLVTVDTEKIDQAIREAKVELALSRLALAQAKHALELQQKTTKLDLASARRSKRHADQDLSRFLTIDRPQFEDDAEYTVKSSADVLAYAQEELRQLEKMYEADDLTEESEEIVLRRQRDTVERLQRGLRRSKLGRDRALKIALPRQKESFEESVRRQSTGLEKAVATLPAGVTKARFELEQVELEHEKAARRLRRLRKDRQKLDVRAPVDGIVYYGRSTRGSWPAVSTLATKLRPGGTLRTNEVFMTIVRAPATLVGATIEEAQLGKARVGLEGTARPTAYPDTKLPVRMVSVSRVPFAPEKFSGRLKIDEDTDLAIMPGMTCTIALTARDLADVLALPAAAVFTAEDTDFVYVAKDGLEAVKRTVVGKKIGKMFVVKKGLKAGARVLANKPEKKQ